MGRLIQFHSIILLLGFTLSQAQISTVIPPDRTFDWQGAGLHHSPPDLRDIVPGQLPIDLPDSTISKLIP